MHPSKRACAVLLGAAGLAAAQLPPGDGPSHAATVLLEPSPVKFSPALLGQLHLPPGFKVNVFAKDLQHARWMQVAANGDVYLSRPKQADVLLLRDKNRDGEADSRQIVAQNLRNVHGLLLKLLVAAVQGDGPLGMPRVLVDDLPDGSQHPYRTLTAGPDGDSYLAVGSQCNNCVETNPEAATVLRMRPDGSARTVYARGLRNTLGMAFNPVDRILYGFDHGSDGRGTTSLLRQSKTARSSTATGSCWPERRTCT